MTQNNMNNKKQSSVEWLINQLQKSKDWHRVLNEISQMSSARVDIIEQAKAMHKDETKDAYNQGYRDGETTTGSPISRVDISEFNDADIYFENTFGGNNEQQ